jgi:MFS family permease
VNGIPSLAIATSTASRVRWRIVALLMMYIAVCHFNRVSMSVAGTEQIIPRYNIDKTTMGFVYSGYLLLYTICMIPGGWFIDRFGTRTALMVVGFGSAVFVALTGVAGMFFATAGALAIALLAVRGTLGVITAPIHPSAGRAVQAWMPVAARSTANGLVIGASCLGVASTYFIFGELSDVCGWEGAFVVSGIVTALLAVLWTSYATSLPGEHRAVHDAERKLIEADDVHALERADKAQPAPGPGQPRASTGVLTTLLLLAVSYGAVNYVEYLFFYWIQFYFETALNLGKTTGRLYSTLLTLALGVGIMAGGWLADWAVRRFGRSRGLILIPVSGLVVCALGLGLGLLSANQTLSLCCFAAALAAVGATEGPFWTCAVALGGRRGGKAGGILNMGGNAGGLLAPIITPLFSDEFGWEASLWLAAAVSLLGVLPWLWIDPAPKSQAVIVDID